MQKIYTLLFLIISFSLSAQVGVGTRNPDASAMFQVESNNKGILIPKVALTSASDIATVTSPANGLLVFNTSSTSSSNDSLSPGFYFYNGSEWKRLLNSGDELVTTYSAGEGIELDGTSFSVSSNVVTSTYTGDIDVTGDITATAFVGDGSGLTNVLKGSGVSSIAMGYGTKAPGQYSTAMGFNTQATGDYSTAMGLDTKALEDFSIAMGIYTEASGLFSSAMGYKTEASGRASTAMGANTEASGQSSTAMGIVTEASGQSSTAMGSNTQASAKNSLAAGESTLAESRGEFVIGGYNKTTSGVSSITWVTTDPLFTVGNGTSSSNRSNAFQILKNGDATFYSNLTVKKDLDVKGDIDVTGDITANAFVGDGSGLTDISVNDASISSSKLADESVTNSKVASDAAIDFTKLDITKSDITGLGIPTEDTDTTYSAGVGLELNGTSFSVNSNVVTSTYTGDIDVTGDITANAFIGDGSGLTNVFKGSGDYSTAMGSGTKASGDYSIAMGFVTNASGYMSTAMGYNTKASGAHSTAMGFSSKASGIGSTAMGKSTEATGDYSTVMGHNTEASGNYSTAMGRSTVASGEASTSMGYLSKASGTTSTAMGRSTVASGLHSTAVGNSTRAKAENSFAAGSRSLAESYTEFVIGSYNETTSGVSSETWVTTDPLFTVGNGTSLSNRSNAFQILKNGDATFYDKLEVKGTLTESSDIRLKKNIVNISNATETINKLSPKRYNKKTKLTSEEYSIEEMGFIAQDIEKILPFLVTKDNSADEILSLDYTSFIALLTQGFKEQSAKIEMQTNKLEQLEAQTTKLNQLEERLKSIEKLLNENQP